MKQSAPGAYWCDYNMWNSMAECLATSAVAFLFAQKQGLRMPGAGSEVALLTLIVSQCMAQTGSACFAGKVSNWSCTTCRCTAKDQIDYLLLLSCPS